jgi:hypothetical protein
VSLLQWLLAITHVYGKNFDGRFTLIIFKTIHFLIFIIFVFSTDQRLAEMPSHVAMPMLSLLLTRNRTIHRSTRQQFSATVHTHYHLSYHYKLITHYNQQIPKRKWSKKDQTELINSSHQFLFLTTIFLTKKND